MSRCANSMARTTRSSAPTRSSPGAATPRPRRGLRWKDCMAEHDHHHHHHERPGSALSAAAALTVAFAIVEALGGWWTGSLALLSDAGHMVTDGAALALGGLAPGGARRPPSQPPPAGPRRARGV